PHGALAHAVDRTQEVAALAVGLVALFLLVRRLRILRGPARRVQAPLLLTAVVTVAYGVVWLSWVTEAGAASSTLETIGRAVAVSPPRPMPGGAGSTATSTTGRSRAWCHFLVHSAWRHPERPREWRASSRAHRTMWRGRSRGAASSRGESIRPCSETRASSPP